MSISEELLISFADFMRKILPDESHSPTFSIVQTIYINLYQKLTPQRSRIYNVDFVNENGGIKKFRKKEKKRMEAWKQSKSNFGEEYEYYFNLAKQICFDKQFYDVNNEYHFGNVDKLLGAHFSRDDFSYLEFLLSLNDVYLPDINRFHYFNETVAMAYMRVMKKEPPLLLRHSPMVNFGKTFRYLEKGNQPLANLENNWKHFVGTECP
jgi:hypothetical protein